MKPSDNENPDMVKENEAEVTKVLEALLKIHPKVFFIPGNVCGPFTPYLNGF